MKLNIIAYMVLFISTPIFCSLDENDYRKRQKLDEYGNYDVVDYELLRKSEIKTELKSKVRTIEEACILGIRSGRLSPENFIKVLAREGYRDYRDAQGHSWWDHAKAANNEIILFVLRHQGISK